ncbi:MAG: Ig-like domain-containing protein [Paraperlucidibaca sp.]
MSIRLVSVMAAALLAACSGGGSGGGNPLKPVIPDMPGPNAEVLPQQRSLIYAYPAPGQTEIIPATPIALRFSHPVGSEFNVSNLAARFTLCEESQVSPQGLCAAAGRVALSAAFVPMSGAMVDRRGVILTPATLLKEKTQYRLSSNGLLLDTGAGGTAGTLRNVAVQAALPGQPLIFTTRAALEGPVNARSTNITAFDVEHITPNPSSFLLGDEGIGLLDFSTIRLQFTQPIDIKTLRYGSSAADTVRLTDGSGALVPATVLVSGNQLSIDPVADLDSTQRYTLRLSPVLKSLKGTAFGAQSAFAAFTFTPLKTTQSSSAKSLIPTSGLSLLLGTPVNEVPVASPLLGQGARAPKPQAQGQLIADLGLPANLPFAASIAPLRVRKNSQLTAASLVVKLDGVVPANLQTDTLTIKMISDANGFLLPNRYSLSPVAPSLVTLEMDIALSAKNKTSNGAFTQTLLHVPVSGLATFDQANETITIDAVGTIEMKILGTDNAIGVLALQLVVDLKQNPVVDLVFADDGAAPLVSSWVPGNTVRLRDGLMLKRINAMGAESSTIDTLMGGTVPGGQLLRPGDPVIVNFDRVMDIDSFRAAGASQPIRVLNNGAAVPFSWRLDGVSLVITPDVPFAHGQNYSVLLAASIKSLGGQSLITPPLSFSMPSLAAGDATANPDGGPDTRRPPVVLGVYPGFPCGVMATTRNVAANIQGKCAGGKASDEDIPLPSIDSRRDISVTLSQTVIRTGINAVNAGSMCNDPNASFRVERINASGTCLESVAGKLGGTTRELRFTPDDPWKVGELYRYVLGSSGLGTATCTASSICGTNNLPLQTQLISQAFANVSNPQHGGPPMEIVFKVSAVPAPGSVVNLRLLPNADVDANFRYEPLRNELRPVCANQNSAGVAALPSGSCDTPNGALLLPDVTRAGGSFSGAARRFALGCMEGESGGVCEDKQFLRVSSALSATLTGFSKNDGSPITDQDFASLCTATATGGGGIDVLIDPGLIVTNGADIYAEIGLSLQASPVTNVINELISLIPVLGPILTGAIDQGADLLNQIVPIVVDQPLFTGPLVFRMRHLAPTADEMGTLNGTVRAERIPGKLRGNCAVDALDGKLKPRNPSLSTVISLYTDIPEIDAKADVGLLKTLTDLGIPVISDITGLTGIPIDHDARSNTDITNLKVSGTVEFLPDGRLTARLVNDDPVRLSANLSALGGLVAGSLHVIVPKDRFVLNSALAPLKN